MVDRTSCLQSVFPPTFIRKSYTIEGVELAKTINALLLIKVKLNAASIWTHPEGTTADMRLLSAETPVRLLFT